MSCYSESLVIELEETIRNFTDIDYDNEETRLYFPYFNTYYKKDHPELYEKYAGITMKDMIHSDYLTKDFCDWCFNVYEWNYECNAGGRGDNENFFDIIPPMLNSSNYNEITNLSITFTKLKKIEYLPNKIEMLDLACNQIEKIENIPSLVKYLDLSSNKIRKIENIPPNTDNLKLSGNLIDKIENVPDSVNELYLFNGSKNFIKKIENLPKNISKFSLDWENISGFGDLSNIKNNIEIFHNQNNDITTIPLTKLIITLNYYPKSFKVINYINKINLQYHYFRKWREIILTKRERQKFRELISNKEDDASKLKRLLFYLLTMDHYGYLDESFEDYWNADNKQQYLRGRKNKYDKLENSLKFFEELYNKNDNNGKESVLKDLTEELMKIVGNKFREQKNHKIKILLNPKNFLNVKKKKILEKKIFPTIEEIKSIFREGTEERKLLNYFIDNNLIVKSKMFFLYEKNSHKYILKYPFYNGNDILTQFLEINSLYYNYYTNEEIIDSECEIKDENYDSDDLGLFD